MSSPLPVRILQHPASLLKVFTLLHCIISAISAFDVASCLATRSRQAALGSSSPGGSSLCESPWSSTDAQLIMSSRQGAYDLQNANGASACCHSGTDSPYRDFVSAPAALAMPKNAKQRTCSKQQYISHHITDITHLFIRFVLDGHLVVPGQGQRSCDEGRKRWMPQITLFRRALIQL